MMLQGLCAGAMLQNWSGADVMCRLDSARMIVQDQCAKSCAEVLVHKERAAVIIQD